MQAIQYIRLIGKEFVSLTDAELHLGWRWFALW